MRGCSRGAQKARKDKEALGAFEGRVMRIAKAFVKGF